MVKQAVEQGVSAFTDRLIADNRPEDAQLYLYKASTTGGTSGEFLRAQRDKVETALQVKQAKLRADSAVAELKAASTPTGRLVTTLMANGGIADSWGRESCQGTWA